MTDSAPTGNGDRRSEWEPDNRGAPARAASSGDRRRTLHEGGHRAGSYLRPSEPAGRAVRSVPGADAPTTVLPAVAPRAPRRTSLIHVSDVALPLSVALWAIGLDVGPLIGMVAGLVSFVPYLGFITGLLASLIAALVQYHDWQHVVMVLIVFGIGQVLEGYVLVPRRVGGKIGLHPVAVIFAILAFGQLFGFLGVLLALPISSVLMVLLRYVRERYVGSALYDERAASAAESAPVTLELELAPEELHEDEEPQREPPPE